MKQRNKFFLSLMTLTLSLGVVSLSSCVSFETITNIKKINKTYSDEELKAIYASSINALNEVNYPSKTQKHNKYDDEFVLGVKTFNESIFSKHIGNNSNFVYCPTNLYSSLHFLSLGASEEASLLIDNALHVNKDSRITNYKKYFENNYFVSDNGLSNIYNALFIKDTPNFILNPNYLDNLTDHYCEAYSLDFKNENAINNMIYNINKKVNEPDLLKREDIKITDYTAFILFNTFLFDHRWSNTFSTDNNYKDIFYSFDDQKEVTYMTHSFVGSVKEYANHMVFEDYLLNGYKVRYYVTKEASQDIRDYVSKDNYFDELVYDYENMAIINLSIPKFEFKNTINFNDSLKEIGLSTLFKEKENFNNCFTFLDGKEHTTFIENSIQATKVKFDNDGASFKSIQATSIGEATSPAPIDGRYEIKLENPFIFEIRDEYNLPILFGLLNDIN